MTRVGIVGTGHVRFTTDSHAPLEGMLHDASAEALECARNISNEDVGTIMVSTNDDQKYLGAILAESLGVRTGAAQTLESLCTSGSSAVISAYAHIRAGLADVALVAGADMFDCPGRVFDWDVSRGDDARPILWASKFALSYKEKFGISDEQIATVAARSHTNAQANDAAYVHDAHTPTDVTDSRVVAPSLRLLECSRACTGASALVLASEDVAKRACDAPAWITGVSQCTLGASMTKNTVFSRIESAALAARDALGMAGIAAGDVDVAEVHDAFAVCEPMILESLGIAHAGEGAQMLCDMYGTRNRMINPRGGILGSGHALGATGVAQTAEIAAQISRRAGPTQVDSARAGLIHNMAAAATSSSVLILQP